MNIVMSMKFIDVLPTLQPVLLPFPEQRPEPRYRAGCKLKIRSIVKYLTCPKVSSVQPWLVDESCSFIGF